MSYYMKILLLLIFSLTFNSTFGDEMKDTDSNFTYNIQLAGYDFKQFDEKGEIDYEKFKKVFDEFPWIEQIEERIKIGKGCSPTISVKSKLDEKALWISMAGDKNKNAYLIGYVVPKLKKGLLGLNKPKKIKWVEIYITDKKEIVFACFLCFFQRDFSLLEEKIKSIDKYDEMEAYNQD